MAIQEQAPDIEAVEPATQKPEGFMHVIRQNLGKRSTRQVVQDPADYEFDGPCTD